MENLQSYIMVREAARFLGVSAGTLRNWEKSGKIKTHRNPVNGYRLYKKKDLEALLKQVVQSSRK
ncbi:MAG: MerR family DNA-binding transcriptional regulator [Deltaproteobacteria bacterium]|nr:MerR family DNA-binding transcriptional regulator [Deltaproteobacteria bacterium]